MIDPNITKLGTVETPIGPASVLRVRNRRLLAFPDVIDCDSKIALETHYGTLQWPKPLLLSRISEFPPGPALPGYLLISLEESFATLSPPSLQPTGNRPRHIREFLSNVLAGLAASVLIVKS